MHHLFYMPFTQSHHTWSCPFRRCTVMTVSWRCLCEPLWFTHCVWAVGAFIKVARSSHALLGTRNNSKNTSSLAKGTVTGVDSGGSESEEGGVNELHDGENKSAFVCLLNRWFQLRLWVRSNVVLWRNLRPFINVAASRTWDSTAERLVILDQNLKDWYERTDINALLRGLLLHHGVERKCKQPHGQRFVGVN